VKYVQENFCTWSGDKAIDDFIKEKQQNVTHPSEFFEWISYDQFENIKKLGKGEDFTIYSAIWKNGYLYEYNEENQEFIRHKNMEIVLRCLDNLKDINEDLFRKVQYL
jgi:hypothetical protein